MRRAFLFTALAVGACTLPGERPTPPDRALVVPPLAWRTQPLSGGAIRADWWQAFGDPLLTALVESALTNNVDVDIAASRVEEARAAEALSRAQLLPQVGGSVPETQGQTLSPFGTPSRAFATQPALSASYDLDLFGRLRLANRAARAQLLASEAARDTVRLATAAAAASGYISLRALDQRLVIARQTLAARSDALRIARRRFQTGYSSRLEFRQAEGEYSATAQLVPAAQLAIARQENALSVLTGVAPGTIRRGRPLGELVAPPIPDGLPADLLRRRPDIFQAEQTLVAADRLLDSQRAAMLPNVALTGSAGLVLSTALSNPVGVFSLGASILAPIFDGGRLSAQQDAAAARRDQAAFAYRRTALVAFREVEDSLVGVRRTGEQATDLVRQTEAARGALQNASNRYRAGYSAYIEQLDAQRSLLTAELSLVQIQTDRLINYVTLYQAMGGGWSSGNIIDVRR